MSEKFSEDILRFIAAEVHLLNAQTAARELFGRSYFSLRPGDRNEVNQKVYRSVFNLYRWVTPEHLAGKEEQPPTPARSAEEDDVWGMI